MKTLSIFLINFVFTAVLFAQNTGNLTVTFDEVSQAEGDLYIGIYEKDNFLGQPTLGKVLKVNEDTNEVTFEGLEHGEYAISVYQDLNNNQQFDMDEYGRPAEPWVMSGSVNPNQMPIFEDAKISFNSTQKKVSLKI